jgi:glycosyltransferase involved in cell wall biosynthesis
MKKLLVITQAVDRDASALGFFVEWLREFARQRDEVHVIAFKVGAYDLPPNIHVHPVRVASGDGRLRRLFRYWALLWEILPQVDAVFTHMSPEYLIAATPLVLTAGKPVIHWYAHREVSWRLKLVALIADRVATVTPNTFNLSLPNKIALGHGIPTDLFRPVATLTKELRLVTVGRITPIKRLELMIEALAQVRQSLPDATLDIYGEPIMEADFDYERRLKARVAELGLAEAVHFRGPVAFAESAGLYESYALALNAAPTGAPDKTVLEAMSCAVPVVVVNQTFVEILGPEAGECVAEPTPESVAAKSIALLKGDATDLGQRLRVIIEEKHSLKSLIARLIAAYAEIS